MVSRDILGLITYREITMQWDTERIALLPVCSNLDVEMIAWWPYTGNRCAKRHTKKALTIRPRASWYFAPKYLTLFTVYRWIFNSKAKYAFQISRSSRFKIIPTRDREVSYYIILILTFTWKMRFILLRKSIYIN